MRNLTNVFTFALGAFLSVSASSASLESLGWTKTTDDFDGTVKYGKEGTLGFACKSFSATQTFGVVMGEPKRTPLIVAFSFYGSEESFNNEANLRVKTDSGISDVDLTCSSDYKSGSWNATCYAQGINAPLAKELASTSFARVDLASQNIDLKANGECSKVLEGINQHATEYLKAQELVVKDGVHTKLNIEENIEEAVKRRAYVDDLLEELTVEELMEANTSKL